MAIKSFSALGEKFGLKPREDPPPAKNFKPKKNYQPPTPKSFPRQATAPYNFVPLPEKILPAPFELKNFCEYITEHGNLSGEILLDITALTPLFIGGKGSKSFAPVNRPIILGSFARHVQKHFQDRDVRSFSRADNFAEKRRRLQRRAHLLPLSYGY